jgi:tRNA threonylcarbamoyladenosine biosynthesis protein TsaB
MLLGINTATDALSLCLLEDGRVLAEAVRDVGTEHSEPVFDLLEALFAWTGRPAADLRGVGVAIGPGGFTGVRTGLTLAKTVAQVRNLPVYGVETLVALAEQFAGPAAVSAMLDARRGLVFAGLYVREGVIEPGALMPLETWLERLAMHGGPLVVVGEGAARHRDTIQAALPGAWLPPDALMTAHAAPIALAAERRLLAGSPGDGAELAPLYLREPQAVVNWEAAQEKAR